MTTANVRVSPVRVRANPRQQPPGAFRRGPDTSDGWWVVSSYLPAVRVIVDTTVPELAMLDFHRLVLDAAYGHDYDTLDEFLRAYAAGQDVADR